MKTVFASLYGRISIIFLILILLLGLAQLIVGTNSARNFARESDQSLNRSLAADLANHASEMYARNLFNLLSPAISDGELGIDWEDEVFAGALLTRDGEVIHGPSREQLADRSTQGNKQ